MTNGQCTFVSYEIESKSEFIASMKDIASILSSEKTEESIEQYMDDCKVQIEERLIEYEKQLPKFIDKIKKFVDEVTYESEEKPKPVISGDVAGG